MKMLYQSVSLICVAALWGCTNPLIKQNAKDIVKVEADTVYMQFLLELKYLFTNIPYLIPMALNQLGSLIYFITLQSADLSLSVPVANSLTFVFTAIAGWCLGEDMPGRNTIIGVVLILSGVTLCCLDKMLVPRNTDL